MNSVPELMELPMRVLVVSNMYPTSDRPLDGIFVKRQLEAVRAAHPGLTIRVCHIETTRNRWCYVTGMLKVRREVMRFKPDLLHIHYGLTQWLCRFVADVPAVVTFHGSDLTIPWQRFVSLRLLRRNWRPVLVSGQLADYLPENIGFDVVACGVNAAEFRKPREDARRKMGIEDRQKLIIFGADPARQAKRYDRFMESISSLSKEIQNIEVMRLSDVPIALVPTLLSAGDVLLMTSDREGSPVVTKEALCAGLRVVSTPVGDVADQIRGLSGCRVGSFSPHDLATAAIAVLAEPAPDAALAAKRFDHSVEVASLARIYARSTAR